LLEIGTDLILEPIDSMDGKEQFRSRVVDREENTIYIDYPINLETNRMTFFMDGMQLNASFIEQSPSSAVYMFQTEVIGRVKRDIPMMMLHDPGAENYLRIQRRKYVRVQTQVDISVHFENHPPFTAVTEDISAGGVAVAIPPQLEVTKGTQGEIVLVLPIQDEKYHYMKLSSVVVRLHNQQERRVASLEFRETTSAEQQMLIRFCFERQLLMKRKGLI